MVSNLLKRWQDDSVTVKRQRDGFGAFRKETGCHPASSRPTSSTDSGSNLTQNFYHSMSINCLNCFILGSLLEVLSPYMYTLVPSHEMTAKITMIHIVLYEKQ
jgi:hypothetical protein